MNCRSTSFRFEAILLHSYVDLLEKKFVKRSFTCVFFSACEDFKKPRTCRLLIFIRLFWRPFFMITQRLTVSYRGSLQFKTLDRQRCRRDFSTVLAKTFRPAATTSLSITPHINKANLGIQFELTVRRWIIKKTKFRTRILAIGFKPRSSISVDIIN